MAWTWLGLGIACLYMSALATVLSAHPNEAPKQSRHALDLQAVLAFGFMVAKGNGGGRFSDSSKSHHSLKSWPSGFGSTHVVIECHEVLPIRIFLFRSSHSNHRFQINNALNQTSFPTSVPEANQARDTHSNNQTEPSMPPTETR